MAWSTEGRDAKDGAGRQPHPNREIEKLCAIAGRPEFATKLAPTLTREQAHAELLRLMVEEEGPEIRTRPLSGEPLRTLAPDPALLREFATYRADELAHLEETRGGRLHCECPTCADAAALRSSKGGGPVANETERTRRRTLAAQVAYDRLVEAGRFGTASEARTWLSVQAGRLRRAIRRGKSEDVLRILGTPELEEAKRLADDVLRDFPLPKCARAPEEARDHYRAMAQAFSDRVPGLSIDDPAVVRVADVCRAVGGPPAWPPAIFVAEASGQHLGRRDLHAVPSVRDIEREAMQRLLREYQAGSVALERLDLPDEDKERMRRELAALSEHARSALAIVARRRPASKRPRGRPLDRGFNRAVYETAELIRRRKGSGAYDWVATTLALIYHGWGPYLAGLNPKQQRKRVRDAHARELERRGAPSTRIKRS